MTLAAPPGHPVQCYVLLDDVGCLTLSKGKLERERNWAMAAMVTKKLQKGNPKCHQTRDRGLVSNQKLRVYLVFIGRTEKLRGFVKGTLV